jgi:hypothetical protein
MNFDHYAENYRDTHNRHLRAPGDTSAYFTKQKKEISAHIQERNVQPLQILDFGCGDGLKSL